MWAHNMVVTYSVFVHSTPNLPQGQLPGVDQLLAQYP